MKMAQQVIENERLFHILQMGQESIIKQLMNITSDLNKEQNKGAIKVSMEDTETKNKEKKNQIKQLYAKLLALLSESHNKSFILITIFHVSVWAFLTNTNYGPRHFFSSICFFRLPISSFQ